MYEDFDPRTKEQKRQDRLDAQNREQRREKMLKSGMTTDQVLQHEGVTGQKGGGGSPWKNLYGEGGLYSTYGGAVLPGWKYDWLSGMKFPEATSDPNRKWEPITDHERQGYREWEAFTQANPKANDWGDFLSWQGLQGNIKQGHSVLDPKSGNYYNVGTGTLGDPSSYSEWWDPLGHKISGMGYKGTNFGFTGGPQPSGGTGGTGGTSGGAGNNIPLGLPSTPMPFGQYGIGGEVGGTPAQGPVRMNQTPGSQQNQMMPGRSATRYGRTSYVPGLGGM